MKCQLVLATILLSLAVSMTTERSQSTTAVQAVSQAYWWTPYYYTDYCFSCWSSPAWYSYSFYSPSYIYNFAPYSQYYYGAWYDDYVTYWDYSDYWYDYDYSVSWYDDYYTWYDAVWRTKKAADAKPNEKQLFFSKIEPLVKEMEVIKMNLFNDSKKNLKSFRAGKAEINKLPAKQQALVLKLLAQEQLIASYIQNLPSKQ